jgi:hypothetical protein
MPRSNDVIQLGTVSLVLDRSKMSVLKSRMHVGIQDMVVVVGDGGGGSGGRGYAACVRSVTSGTSSY